MNFLYSTIHFCTVPRFFTMLLAALILVPIAFGSVESQKTSLLPAFFPVGHLVEPNQDMNPDTRIAINAQPVSNGPEVSVQPQAPLVRVLEPLAAKLEPSRKIAYKSVGKGRALELHVFEPEEHDASKDRRPCILCLLYTSPSPRD